MAYRRSSHVTSADVSAIACNDAGLYLLDELLSCDGDGEGGEGGEGGEFDELEEDDDEASFLFESLSDIFVTEQM